MIAQVHGIRLNYDTFGKGSPLVMVHGWNGESKSLLPLAKKLEDKFTIYLLDLPGFGGSSVPPQSWEPEDYVDTVLEFTKLMNLGTFSYIGHSFGGGIGVKIAAEHPSLIENLFLVAAAYHRDPQTATSVSLLKRFLPKYDSVKKRAVYPRKIYYKIFHPRSDSMRRPELETIFRKIIAQDLSPMVKSIRSRTYIFWGQNDLATPVKDAYFLHENIKDSILKVYKDVGHNLPITRPDMLAADILALTSKSQRS